MKFLVAGGYPKKNASSLKEGYRYETAYINIIDWNAGKIISEFKYNSPKEHRDINASQQFKFGTIYNDILIIPTSTEIIFFDYKQFKIKKTISDPSFNDLHHVNIIGDLLYIANTGKECVQIMDMDGNLIKEYDEAPNATWKKKWKNQDLRFVGTTKPHEVHLNYIFFIDQEPWITRFQQKDAVSLYDKSKKIDLNISLGNPHDGLVLDNYIYFTITDGFIVIVNKRTLKKEEIINLNNISLKNTQLGWCRGIEVVGTYAFVGFSRLRESKFREYGKWIFSFKKRLPARIAQYDLKEKKLIKEMVFSKQGAAIFSINKI